MKEKNVHNETQEVSTESFSGIFSVVAGLEDDYPGVDVEFEVEGSKASVMPRVLFEELSPGELRVVIWAEPENDDPTFEYNFDLKKYKKAKNAKK